MRTFPGWTMGTAELVAKEVLRAKRRNGWVGLKSVEEGERNP